MKVYKYLLIFLFPFILVLTQSTTLFASESLVIYSGRSDKFVKPVIEEFTRQTGIHVTLHSGKSTALLNKLKVEGNRTDADLFLSNDAGTLQRGSDLGLFRFMGEKIISAVSPALRAPDNTWVGLSARARVLVVNTQGPWANKKLSVFDLAKPEFKDKLGITNSTNGSYIAGVTVYMESAGKEKTRQWLEGMKANVDSKVFNKHSKIVKAVARGKKQVGLVKSKYSKKSDAAKKLVAFLISKAGQKQFAETNREYPTRKRVEAHADVPAAGSYKIANTPMAVLGKQRNETIDLIEKVGMP